MSSAATVELSQADAHILSIILDPEGAVAPPEAPSDHATATLLGFSDDEFKRLDNAQKPALRLVGEKSPSLLSVREASDGMVDLSRRHSNFAPFFVNLAQLRRLQLGEQDLRFTTDTADIIENIVSDLMTGIKLATPPDHEVISPFQRELLATSNTHLGYILYKAFKGTKEEGTFLPPSLAALGPDRLEEMSSYHFAQGGRYGNKAAQTLAVKSNPYAKMCGNIVREALRQEGCQY